MVEAGMQTRYIVRAEGAILAELQRLDTTVNAARRRHPSSPSRETWYKVDRGSPALLGVARGICEAVVQVERHLYPTRAPRTWEQVLELLFIARHAADGAADAAGADD